MLLAVGGYLFPDLEARCIRMSSGFGGGVGGTREELCGALAGSVMLIGGLYGRTSLPDSTDQAYTLVKEMRRRFIERWGTSTCGPIRDWAKSAANPSGTCDVIVAETARIILQLLSDT